MIRYRCPMCLAVAVHDRTDFPRCRGHYMVREADWRADRAAYLVARDHELSLLEPAERDRIVRESEGRI